MKKLLACMLVLAMLCLFACGGIEPPPEETEPVVTQVTTEQTTEQEEITEARPTASRTTPEDHPSWRDPIELRMNETFTVFETWQWFCPYDETGGWGGWAPVEIRMRNETTGEETLLVDNERGRPTLSERINERFFTYYYEWAGGDSGIYFYDLEYQREVFSLGEKILHDDRAYVFMTGSGRIDPCLANVSYFYISELEGNVSIELRPTDFNVTQLLAHIGRPIDCNCEILNLERPCI